MNVLEHAKESKVKTIRVPGHWPNIDTFSILLMPLILAWASLILVIPNISIHKQLLWMPVSIVVTLIVYRAYGVAIGQSKLFKRYYQWGSKSVLAVFAPLFLAELITLIIFLFA